MDCSRSRARLEKGQRSERTSRPDRSRRSGDHRPLPRHPETRILVDMFARYFVELPISPEEVERALSRDPRLWLPGLAERAHHRGDLLLAEVGFGEAVRIKRTVAVELGRSVRTGSKFVFPLRWAASGGADLFPSLDADVTSLGMGLQNLRERVESLGGLLEVESTPGEGTTVRANFPS